jgi:hypothetical protein
VCQKVLFDFTTTLFAVPINFTTNSAAGHDSPKKGHIVSGRVDGNVQGVHNVRPDPDARHDGTDGRLRCHFFARISSVHPCVPLDAQRL